MFSIKRGKYADMPFEDIVNFFGVAYCPQDKAVNLDFHPYYIRLEWGWKNV